MYEKLRKAFKVSVPLVSVTTSDVFSLKLSLPKILPSATRSQRAGGITKTAFIFWDIVSGLSVPAQDHTSTAVSHLQTLLSAMRVENKEDAVRPEEVLRHAVCLPAGSVLVMENLHRVMHLVEVMQSLALLRNVFQTNRRMVLCVGSEHRIPPELRHDFLTLAEPLPNAEDVASIVQVTTEGHATLENLAQVVHACQGLSPFAIDQIVATNIVDGRIDEAGIWQDKCAKIDQVPGLKICRGRSYEQIAGLDQLKKFMRGLMSGDRRPNAVVWLDEIEKAIAGSKSDSSGVAQDQLGQLLYWMEGTKADGCILAGAPGTAKSAFAQATGAEFNVPTIRFDLGAMKGGLVGESEARIREALRILDAVSGGRTIWLATCNSLDRIPPELRRRFRFGTWFLDLPSLEERKAIWGLYCRKYGLDLIDAAGLFARQWTGAEIETCCDLSSRMGLPLEECEQFITPVSVDPHGKKDIENLRSLADRSFLDASRPGVYKAKDSLSSGRSRSGRSSV